MGTRADFYIGRGEQAEWIGSIAWDGHPDSISGHVLSAETDEQFKSAFASFVSDRDDFTSPDMGWPWPWNDSQTTDYAYAFDGGKVYGSCFGHEWFDASKPEPDTDRDDGKPTVFPDMTSIKAMTLGKRSGVMVFGI